MQLMLASRHNGAATCKRTRWHIPGERWCSPCAVLATVLPIFLALQVLSDTAQVTGKGVH
eukprot:1839100-Amphidinium_carterae.1